MRRKNIRIILAALIAAMLTAGCGAAEGSTTAGQDQGSVQRTEQSADAGQENLAEVSQSDTDAAEGESTAEKAQEAKDDGAAKDLTSFTPYNYMLSSSLLSTGNNIRVKKVLEKLRAGETINLAMLGGSITEGAGGPSNDTGYAYQFAERLAAEYGNGSNVNLINAGLSGTPSTLGAMRYEKDILDGFGAEPDMLVIEFAVNDYKEITGERALESLVYQALTDKEDCAVILMFAVAKSKSCEQESIYPIGIHYSVPMVSMKNALQTGAMKDEEYFSDDYHPKKAGHTLMCDCLMKLLLTIDGEAPDGPEAIPTEPKKGRGFEHLQLIYEDTEGVTLDKGAFSSKDKSVQSMYFTGKSSFPDNYMNDGQSGQAPMTITLECTKFLLNYKTANDKKFGEAVVLVDGREAAVLNGYSNSGWNNCNPALIIDGEKPGKHTVEIRMAAGSEDKKFTVLGAAFN